MRPIPWKAGVAGAVLIVTTVYAAAQMAPEAQGPMQPERMMGMMKQMSQMMAPATAPSSQQPYAGLEARSIKALSEQQTADLRAGRGMGLALAAELNGYPGPMHVLELADSLNLSDQQRAKMQELFAAMKAEAIPLGERLIAQETDLDGLSPTRRSPRQA